MSVLSLPDISINIPYDDDICLMVLGGRAPSSDWLASLNFQSETWAVDKGLEFCLDAHITPDMLIGDCDSSSSSAWRCSVELGVPTAKFDSDKDLTDFQLALDIFDKNQKRESLKGIFLSGAFGGRFDHLWSLIISFLHRSQNYIPVGMADDEEGMIFLRGKSSLTADFSKAPEAISLLPFSQECAGVSIKGAKWPLNDVELEYSRPYSISNRAVGNDVRVDIGRGLLGFYWKW